MWSEHVRYLQLSIWQVLDRRMYYRPKYVLVFKIGRGDVVYILVIATNTVAAVTRQHGLVT